MNCHGNHLDKHDGKNHNPMKHMLMMALCCGLPIILISIVSLLGVGNAAIKSSLMGIAPLICPIMMVLMIPMMLRHSNNKGRDCCENKKTEEVGKTKLNKLEN